MEGGVTVKLSGCSAALLAHLTVGNSGEETPEGMGDILSRALGLLDLALKAKREGKQLALYDPARDELSQVVF